MSLSEPYYCISNPPRSAYVKDRPSATAAATMVLVAGLMTACARSDVELRTDLQIQLALSPATRESDVTVTVNRGIVRLSGETETRAQQESAVALVEGSRGVVKVLDEMRLSDEALAADVRRALAADPLVGRTPIEVDSHNGIVRLASDATNADQRRRATRVAARVPGVIQVEDRMR